MIITIPRKSFLRWRPVKLRPGALRRMPLLGMDVALLVLASLSAVVFTYEPSGLGALWRSAAVLLVMVVALNLVPLVAGGTYHIDWKRLTGRDLTLLLKLLLLGSILFMVAAYAAAAVGWIDPPPLRTMILRLVLTVSFIGGSRAAIRMSRELRPQKSAVGARRVLIAGAGDAGMQVARALREEPAGGFQAVGFVDDDPAKLGMVIGGIPVAGNRSDIGRLMRSLEARELWIAMPSAPGSAIREYVKCAQAAGTSEIKIVPGNSALLTGKVNFEDIRHIQLEELLGRDPVKIDFDQVSSFVRDKTVLVTGAAGSIGSEICRQVSRLQPSCLVLMDQDETGIFDLHRELQIGQIDLPLEQVVGDVRDAGQIDEVFKRLTPDVVFHAAAYKHVPLMEEHPDQAVKTNLFGTQIVAKAARRYQAKKFVLISTDKAVNPSSIMGATKRAAEVAIRHAGAWGHTEFVAVRFGNVLGSRGSVVPVFRDQIARGGPVTVTDPEMRRYFMTVPEAVLLVLQAGAIGRNGEVLVLDMGEPLKIVDLARQLIMLSGLKPDVDIPIVFTGMRPGEKLFEDILTAEEGTSATRAERVFVAHTTTALSTEQFEDRLASLRHALVIDDRLAITKLLWELVGTYRRNANGLGMDDALKSELPQLTAVMQEQP